MNALKIAAFAALTSLTCDTAPAQAVVAFPFQDPLKTPSFRNSGGEPKAFKCEASAQAVEIDFKDKAKRDDYLFIDLGHFDLSPFWPGGYVAVDIETDKPALRVTASLADPENFWNTRVALEGEGFLLQGRHEYRFYLDGLLESRARSEKDRLMLFLHDSGKDLSEEAKVFVRKVSLQPQSATWLQEKDAHYAIQFARVKLRELGPLYRGSYERLVPWDSIQSSPFVKTVSLDGAWRKNSLGDLTWNYEALKDASWAAPDFDDSSWNQTEVPEAPVEDQKGGHYVYRRKLQIDAKAGKRFVLRIDDLADYAEIYVNGRKAASQSSTRRRHDWLVEGGSRAPGNAGKSIKEMLAWRNFDRCGIPCPFDKDAIPEGESSLLMPIYAGTGPWPMAVDVSDLMKDGENCFAIRLYGCPVKGFWIFRDSEDDRAFKNVFGILGQVKLAIDPKPVISSFKRVLAKIPGEDGTALHRFVCELDPKLASEADAVELCLDGLSKSRMERGSDGSFSGELRIPAGFGKRLARAVALDKTGKAVDERDFGFPECVVAVEGRKLLVNGDPFFVRGINAAPGVEWENGRIASRREWLRELRALRQMGFNSIRTEGANARDLNDALAEGFMAMPVYAPGSCDLAMTALGNLEKPDFEFLTDAHKEMAITLSSASNALFWNTGNEIHHTPGWTDKPLVDKLLETAREAVHRYDPCGRPAVYANLDTYNSSWFFTKGQDVIGLNTYSDNKRFAGEMESFAKSFEKPFVFTEWGFWDNEAKAVKDRSANLADWESRMKEKWRMIEETPGSVGGYLYAYHGELKDERGKLFLQSLMSPFSVEASLKSISVRNLDVCPFRSLSATLVSSYDAPAAGFSQELKPGETLKTELPKGLKPGAYRLELKYLTHRGLLQTHSRDLVLN